MNLSGESFGTVVQHIFGNRLVVAVMGLIAADVLMGLANAFMTKDFRLAQVADFLLTKAIPYVLGAGGLQIALVAVPPEYEALTGLSSTIIWGFVIAALAGHVLDSAKKLGMPVPDALTAKSKPEAQPTT